MLLTPSDPARVCMYAASSSSSRAHADFDSPRLLCAPFWLNTRFFRGFCGFFFTIFYYVRSCVYVHDDVWV